ncbi:hypothetical protein MYSTI_04535 [Myxococcus stipitatus DSM 14675]|uniref:C-type lectin domain-containing protein n=1 Tax=Myxococcus stipitatus (strain DSM 14675 / JCM 12634 / Mx s8) TaxID=1278073 RepID=L7UDZ4_MYXSD|nr:lectin-like protein [Myxococcus stipitatus]AGC45827.1 hypothetical protein MYSTI_04535 [Myxococcus stipitatus DSM 14675]
MKRARASLLLLLTCLACGTPQAEPPPPHEEHTTSQAMEPGDYWAAHAARFQQTELQRDIPIQRFQRLGAHNAHVSNAYSHAGRWYTRINQHRYVYNQLAMGMRALYVDVWDHGCFYDKDEPNDPYGNEQAKGLCFSHGAEPFSTPVNGILGEISTWLREPQNQNEVILIGIEDNEVTSDDSRKRLVNLLRHFLDQSYPNVPGDTRGSLIFTPQDLRTYFSNPWPMGPGTRAAGPYHPNRWPTNEELARMGKRVIISVKDRFNYASLPDGNGATLKDWVFSESSGHYQGGSAEPDVWTNAPGYPANAAKKFTGYPSCGSSDLSGALGLYWTEFSELRICDHNVYCSLPYSAFSDYLNYDTATKCGFSISMDQVETNLKYAPFDDYFSAMRSAIWSFGEDEPNSKVGDEDCAEFKGSTGQWNDLDCSTHRKRACRKVGATCDASYCPSDFWTVTSLAYPWAPQYNLCPDGYDFLPPQNGFENQKLYDRLGGVESAWINFSDRLAEGKWQYEGFQWWSEGEPNNYGNTEHCAVWQGLDGLNDIACSMTRAYACLKIGTTRETYAALPNPWIITDATGPWNTPQCPAGYEFAPPRNASTGYRLQELSYLSGKNAWVNLTDQFEEGRWEEAPYQPWAAGEPNNEFGNEHCVRTYANGTWNDEPCGFSIKHACRCTSQSCTLNDWKLSDTAGAWNKSTCGDGWTFSAPRNSAENEALKQKLQNTSVWVNLTDQAREGRWVHWGGAPVPYTRWASTEPNNYNGVEHCALMTANGTWYDSNCAESYAHACRKFGASCSATSCPADYWALGGAGNFDNPQCPSGYIYSTPKSDLENAALLTKTQGQFTWLKLIDRGHEGHWTTWD